MNLHKMITLTLLSGAIILATPLVAQRPGSVRGVNERSAPASQRTNNNVPERKAQTRQGASKRPGGEARKATARQKDPAVLRPAAKARPGTSVSRPNAAGTTVRAVSYTHLALPTIEP